MARFGQRIEDYWDISQSEPTGKDEILVPLIPDKDGTILGGNIGFGQGNTEICVTRKKNCWIEIATGACNITGPGGSCDPSMKIATKNSYKFRKVPLCVEYCPGYEGPFLAKRANTVCPPGGKFELFACWQISEFCHDPIMDYKDTGTKSINIGCSSEAPYLILRVMECLKNQFAEAIPGRIDTTNKEYACKMICGLAGGIGATSPGSYSDKILTSFQDCAARCGIPSTPQAQACLIQCLQQSQENMEEALENWLQEMGC